MLTERNSLFVSNNFYRHGDIFRRILHGLNTNMILNIKALFEFLAKQKRYTLVNLIVGLETIFLNMRRRRRNA